MKKKAIFVSVITLLSLISATGTTVSANQMSTSSKSKTTLTSYVNSPKELTSLTLLQTMQFESDKYDRGMEYNVFTKGDKESAYLEFLAPTSSGAIGILVETKEGMVAKDYSNDNGYGLITLDSLPIPQEDETIKITLKFNNLQYTYDLKNIITNDIIDAKDAREIFISNYKGDINELAIDGIYFYKPGTGEISWTVCYGAPSLINKGNYDAATVQINAYTGETGDAVSFN